MWRFKMAFNMAARPVVENDSVGNKLWSQISRPREERERTAALRKLVAILRGEMTTTEYEDLEVYVNYEKLIAYVGDLVIAKVTEGNIVFEETNWKNALKKVDYQRFREKYDA